MQSAKRYSDYLKQQLDDLNERRQHSMSLAEDVQKTMAIESKLIESYLTQKDVAPWFRGTSIFHIHGANMLLNALRDDAEQRTTHRIRSCLNLIGLKPMITSKQITFLMRLSRGNDLAFLWFLMEMHYKTTKSDSFSINEQLICSAICHLDTITTLRELDKILPSCHTSRHAKRKEIHKVEKKKTKPKYVLPYFEKLRRPEPYGKSLTLEVPNFKVNFDIYSLYSDPNYVVHNESNRWFANYDFKPGRRIAFRIIRETIGNLFENFEAASLRANTVDVSCDYHKTIKEMEANLEHELRVKTRDECLKRYFGSGEVKKERAKHIKALLDKAIEQQLYKFRKQANTLRKEMTLKTITSDNDIYDIVLGGEFNECCGVKPELIDARIREKKEIKLQREKYRYKNNNKFVNNNEAYKTTGEGAKTFNNGNIQPHDCGDSFNCKEPFTRNVLIPSDSNPTLASQASEFADSYMRNYDYGHISETPPMSQIFFQRPKEHEPFKFDYEKIFTTKSKDDDKRRIKKSFVEALNNDISTLTGFQKVEPNLDKAASDCANNIFNNELKKYQEENISVQMAETQRPLNQYPKLANYNADDRNQLDQMLIDAFECLRKNPKFVWAQLPDAHKVPMLREWIAQRFGKEYSPKERTKAYRLSCKIFRALDKINFDFSMPNANQLGKNFFLKYNCRNYLDKKSKHIKDKYYHRLNTAFMEHTRIFWFAMRAYVCSNGPPRKTFFAYMPSRFGDIQHFRLWKSSECRNYKGAWDARQRAKRREEFYG